VDAITNHNTAQKKRFLVVEDESDIANLVAMHLSDLDAVVAVESDGRSAFHRALAESFDAIILDLQLPGMNGLDICRAIRAQANFIPILMRSEEHTSELQSLRHLVCRLLLVKKNPIICFLHQIKHSLNRTDAILS